MDSKRIDVQSQPGASGDYTELRVEFGPHYFLELRQEGEGVTLYLGATHHGFKADASQVGGELENYISEIRRAHPQSTID